MRCDYRLQVRGRRYLGSRCPHPAKFTVVGANRDGTPKERGWPYEADGPHACGRHVRPALMDNGDSVWKPWVVQRLDPASTR